MASDGQGTGQDSWVTLLPGMGIIRIRALRKHGFITLETIAAADPADLLRIPGFTEAKVAQAQAAAIAALADAGLVPGLSAGEPEATTASVEEIPEPTPELIAEMVADLAAAVAEEPSVVPEPELEAAAPAVDVWPITVLFSSVELVSHEAEVLLRPWRSVEFGKGLCRQLKRWVQFAQYLEEFGIRAGVPVGREIERLKGLQGLLTDALTAERVGPKKQKRLAKALRDRRRALQRKFKEDDDAVVS